MVGQNKTRAEIKEALVKVIEHAILSSSYHEKYVRLLETVYNQSNFEEFLDIYLRCTLNTLTYKKTTAANSLLISFLAKFVAHINKQAENHQNEDSDDESSHPFLIAMISEALKLHGLANEIIRCNACTFVSQILDSLKESNLDEQLCNKLQEAMLERLLQDNNVVVRLRAVRALARLQDVESGNCPVIAAYVRAMNDTAEAVRKEVIKEVAPMTKSVVHEIRQHTRDTHPSVRIEAFIKCSSFGHKIFTLRDRQFILQSGFTEEKENVRKCFYSVLLPTWLTAINKDYVEMLKAIMMNGDDDDISLSKYLGQKLVKAFFTSEPINSLLEILRLDEQKVLLLEHWTYERIIYWNLITSYLRQHEDMDEFLERVLPELTPLCKFIEEFIASQSKNFKTDQDYLNFQVSLYYLFDMASKYDLADEVGRRTLQTIVKNVLTNFKSYQINTWNSMLMSEIVKIARKLSPDPVKFLEEICQLISDIREPLVDQQPSIENTREKQFKIAELKVKINIAEGNLEDAVENQLFEKAASIKEQLNQLRKHMEELVTPPPSQSEQIRISRDDPETICWCLDLLNTGIQHSGIYESIKNRQNNPLPPALIVCLDEFLKPLVKNSINDVSWRALKCILDCCMFDKKLAAEYVSIMCVQLVHYQAIPNFNKETVVVAIEGICDFIMVYGVGMFEPTAKEDTNSTTSLVGNSKKKLYTSEDGGEHAQTLINTHLKIDYIMEVIFDMLDDEHDDVRTTALTALAKLMLSSTSDLTTSPQIMTRVILKYFNPLTGINPERYNELKRSRKAYEKASGTMSQVLGSILNCYIRDKKDAKVTLEKATVPIITALANAPKSSPLSEINVDKVIELLAGLTLPGPTDVIDVQRSLAHTLCKEIAAHPHENAVIYYAKMLNRLIIISNDSPQNKELITKAELLLEIDELEPSIRRHISHFIRKLTEANTNNTMDQTQNQVTTNTTAVNTTVADDGENHTVLPTILEDDNETFKNDNSEEPQNKKSRRESDKENNVNEKNKSNVAEESIGNNNIEENLRLSKNKDDNQKSKTKESRRNENTAKITRLKGKTTKNKANVGSKGTQNASDTETDIDLVEPQSKKSRKDTNNAQTKNQERKESKDSDISRSIINNRSNSEDDQSGFKGFDESVKGNDINKNDLVEPGRNKNNRNKNDKSENKIEKIGKPKRRPRNKERSESEESLVNLSSTNSRSTNHQKERNKETVGSEDSSSISNGLRESKRKELRIKIVKDVIGNKKGKKVHQENKTNSRARGRTSKSGSSSELEDSQTIVSSTSESNSDRRERSTIRNKGKGDSNDAEKQSKTMRKEIAQKNKPKENEKKTIIKLKGRPSKTGNQSESNNSKDNVSSTSETNSNNVNRRGRSLLENKGRSESEDFNVTSSDSNPEKQGARSTKEKSKTKNCFVEPQGKETAKKNHSNRKSIPEENRNNTKSRPSKSGNSSDSASSQDNVSRRGRSLSKNKRSESEDSNVISNDRIPEKQQANGTKQKSKYQNNFLEPQGKKMRKETDKVDKPEENKQITKGRTSGRLFKTGSSSDSADSQNNLSNTSKSDRLGRLQSKNKSRVVSAIRNNKNERGREKNKENGDKNINMRGGASIERSESSDSHTTRSSGIDSLIPNSQSSDSSSPRVTRKNLRLTAEKDNELLKKNGTITKNGRLTLNDTWSSSDEDRNKNKKTKNQSSKVTKTKTVDSPMRRSGRFTEGNQNKANRSIIQNLSQSIQTKRKKSRTASMRKSDSFDDTTILRTIIEPSEHHISLLADDSLPAIAMSKSIRRTLTVMSETSSESGSPLRQVKKSRKKK